VLGPCNCIGRNLAYAEMLLVLARLLWGAGLEFPSGDKGEGARKLDGIEGNDFVGKEEV
jgi:hypothetical protein